MIAKCENCGAALRVAADVRSAQCEDCGVTGYSSQWPSTRRASS